MSITFFKIVLNSNVYALQVIGSRVMIFTPIDALKCLAIDTDRFVLEFNNAHAQSTDATASSSVQAYGTV